MRRISGVWPPSKPTSLPSPERERWPFWPRVAVWPVPEPSPMPRRTRRRRAPTVGLRFARVIGLEMVMVSFAPRLLAAQLGDVFFGAELLQRLERGADGVERVRRAEALR